MIKKISPIIIFLTCVLFTTVNIFFQILSISTHVHFESLLSINFAAFASILSIYMLFYALFQIPAGVALDKYGVKIMLPLSIFICLIGYVGFIFAKSTNMIMFARATSGAASATSYISAVYVASKYLSRKYLAIAITAIEIITTIVSVWWETKFIEITNTYGWYYANSFVFLVLVLTLILALVFSRYLKNNTESHQNESLNISELSNAFIGFFKNKIILALFVYSLFTWLVMMSFAGCWIQSYLIHVYSYSMKSANFIFDIYWWSFMLSSLIVGRFLDRVDFAILFLPILAFLGFVTFIVLPFFVNMSSLMIITFVVIAGFSASGVIAAFTIGLNLVEPRIAGTMSATLNTFLVLGGYLGDIIFGDVLSSKEFAHVFKHFAENYYHPHLIGINYQTAFFIYPIATFLALIASVYILRKFKKNSTNHILV